METFSVPLEFPDGTNVILGYSHFIKTVEDLTEVITTAVPGAKFGLAFSEASGDRLIRYDGTDDELEKIAIKNLQNLAAGHTFLIILRNLYPINVLNAIKSCQEVGSIFAATSNPVEVLLFHGKNGNGIVGVVDGFSPLGVENGNDKNTRRKFLRDIGYKK
ncbi:MAG: adenosine monophosphate-protein transferase [Thermoplasmatales archaeon B_DKE]|nr:MAG: adenosine monophosphate-protein transferase [Thermoplasmatales archaeon B_DKE]